MVSLVDLRLFIIVIAIFFLMKKGIYWRQDFAKCFSLARFLSTMNDPLVRKDELWCGEGSSFNTYANECITNVLYTLRATLHPNEKFICSSRDETWNGRLPMPRRSVAYIFEWISITFGFDQCGQTKSIVAKPMSTVFTKNILWIRVDGFFKAISRVCWQANKS